MRRSADFCKAWEEVIELYGVWTGQEAEEPLIRERISLYQIHDPAFSFKERGFYVVSFRPETNGALN